MYFDGKHFLSGRQGDNQSSIWETLASYPSSSRKKRSQPRSPGRNIRRRRRENSSSSRLQRLAISLKKKKKKVDRKYPRNFSRKEAVVSSFSLKFSDTRISGRMTATTKKTFVERFQFFVATILPLLASIAALSTAFNQWLPSPTEKNTACNIDRRLGISRHRYPPQIYECVSQPSLSDYAILVPFRMESQDLSIQLSLTVIENSSENCKNYILKKGKIVKR